MLAARMMFALPLFVILLGGCDSNKQDQPTWQQLPARYDPKGGDSTFNSAALEEFNGLSAAQRAAKADSLKTTPNSLKGQALYGATEQLGELIGDRQYGQYVISAEVPDPVFLEITMEYHLFADQKLIDGVAAKTPIEFTGTLVDLDYQDQSKPRKLTLKVKLNTAEVIKD